MNTFTGALEDTRPEEAKTKDWHRDIAMALPVKWEDKNFESVSKFKVRNQNGSSSCVAQTVALMASIENLLEEGRFVEFSAKDIYTQRSNKGGGMIGVEAFDIWKKKGITFEFLIPSQNISERDINIISRKTSDIEIAKIFAIKDYYQLPFNVNSIATIMESGRVNGVAKPVMVWFQFPRAEWDAKPQVSNSNYDLVRHSITAIEYGIVDGKKGIFIQDSWGLSNSTINGLRFISEDYIKARMIFCAYANDKLNDWQSKTGFVFNRILRRGMKGKDVEELQKLLGKITVDGDFGNITDKAVRKFQKDNGLFVDGIVGKHTWGALNSTKDSIIEIITSVSLQYEIEPELSIAVATCESGLDPKATLYNKASNSTDRGLFQWNSYYHSEITDEMAFDPEKATELFCIAVSEGHLRGYWSASQHCWEKKLSLEILKKYNIK